MSNTQSIAAKPATATRAAPQPLHTFSRLRVLAWHSHVLFASQAYTLLTADMLDPIPRWRIVSLYRPTWWRNLTASARMSYRLFGDGFHALAALPTGHLIASVPGGIISVAPGETEFHLTHQLSAERPPRALIATRNGHVFWAGHQENARRRDSCIYVSADLGFTWDVAHAFPSGVTGIRDLVHDDWDNCIWILTDEEGPNCRVLRASLDFRVVEVAISGSEARMGACVPTRDAVYFASNHPAGSNHIIRLRRNGSVIKIASIDGAAASACLVGNSIFLSTMPNRNNHARPTVGIYRSPDGENWEQFLGWQKDFWHDIFQMGCAFFPLGTNTTDLLAVSTVAVSGHDLETTLWRI